jgi:hypothetical protein
VKNRPALLLNTAANLVTHLGWDAHIASLTGIRAQFDNRYSAAFSKNALVTGTQVGIDVLRISYAFLSLVLSLGLKGSDGSLHSRGFLRHVRF